MAAGITDTKSTSRSGKYVRSNASASGRNGSVIRSGSASSRKSCGAGQNNSGCVPGDNPLHRQTGLPCPIICLPKPGLLDQHYSNRLQKVASCPAFLMCGSQPFTLHPTNMTGIRHEDRKSVV